MKRNKSCKKGAAMLWAVLVMLMVAIISSGIILVSRIYYTREQNENYQLQAQMYAESAIEIIWNDIYSNQSDDNYSKYVSADNSTQTYTFSFPEAENWTCVVTVNHSVVNTSGEDPLIAKKSGQIYLTARVKRKTSGTGKELELAEVCAKMTCSSGKWQFDGYYNL